MLNHACVACIRIMPSTHAHPPLTSALRATMQRSIINSSVALIVCHLEVCVCVCASTSWLVSVSSCPLARGLAVRLTCVGRVERYARKHIHTCARGRSYGVHVRTRHGRRGIVQRTWGAHAGCVCVCAVDRVCLNRTRSSV